MWARGIPLRPLQLQSSPVIAATRIRDAIAALPATKPHSGSGIRRAAKSGPLMRVERFLDQ
jgi:hypothetical protein